MAGIGFVLEKLIRQGRLGLAVQAAVAGTAIVAGPWLLSVFGMLLINTFSLLEDEGPRRLFMLTIVYSYAVSLFVFGGIHYLFSRLVSDFVYENKEREGGGVLAVFLLIIGAGSSLIALLGLRGIDPAFMGSRTMFTAGTVLLFVMVNLNWIVMIFISLLKWYMKIFFTYLIGMAASFLAVTRLGSPYGAGGAVLGYALGQTFIVAVLCLMAFVRFPPKRFGIRGVLKSVRRYGRLLASGMFFYWGIWADKFVFWFAFGSTVPGTAYKLFDPYDVAVYFSNLSIIPGLVFFVVVSETELFRRITVFLESLHDGIFRTIQQKKYDLKRYALGRLKDQTAFQGIVTVILLLMVPDVNVTVFGNSLPRLTMSVSLVSMSSHLFLMTVFVFLLYVECFREAAAVTFLFFAVNLAGSLLVAVLGLSVLVGTSYLAATVCASVLGLILFLRAVRRLDRLILTRTYG